MTAVETYLVHVEDLTEIPDPDFDLEDLYAEKERSKILHQALASLKPKLRRVLEMVYGIDGSAESSLKDIGRLFGVSSNRVSQIRDKALRDLSRRLAKVFLSKEERMTPPSTKTLRAVDEALRRTLSEQKERLEREKQRKEYAEKVAAYRAYRKENPSFRLTDSGHRIVVLRHRGGALYDRIGYLSKHTSGRDEVLDENSWTISLVHGDELFLDEVFMIPVDVDVRSYYPRKVATCTR